MSNSKTALRRVSAGIACLGALGFLLPGGILAEPPAGKITIRGRVLPLVGASTPPSSAMVELRPVLLPFAARRAALHGVEPVALATAPVRGDGSYLLTAPEPGCYQLRVRARGFRTLEIPFVALVEPIDVPPVEPVALRPLAVVVLDPSGQPVAGATVRTLSLPVGAASSEDSIRWRPSAESVHTDGQGRAIVPRSVGEKVRVLVESPAGAGLAEVEVDAPWAEVRFTSQPPLGISVRNTAGRPAVGALVYTEGRAVAELGAEGETDLRSLSPGEPPYLILSEGGEWAEVPAGGKSPAAIRLAPARKARGQALDSNTGRPLPASALVWAVGGSGLAEVVHPEAKGNFEIRVAGSGRPTFGAAAAGYTWRQISAAVPGPRDLPIILRLDRATDPSAAAGLTGILLDEAGGPIGGAELFAVREAESTAGGARTTARKEQRLGTSDIHGGFHAAGLEPGTFDLLARANGYVPGRLQGLTLAPGGRLPELKLVLSRGLRIEGRLRDPQDNPAAGVTVEARKSKPEGGASAAPVPSQPPASYFVTDRGGLFVLSGLEPGTYEVTAENALGRAKGRVEVTADGGRIDLQLGQ